MGIQGINLNLISKFFYISVGRDVVPLDKTESGE
jgi:hypothetical protein